MVYNHIRAGFYYVVLVCPSNSPFLRQHTGTLVELNGISLLPQGNQCHRRQNFQSGSQ